MTRQHVLCDLDSTLADTRHRWWLAPITSTGQWKCEPSSQEAKDRWERYSLACADDPVIPGTLALLRIFVKSGVRISFVSGRDHAALPITRNWLHRHGLPSESIWLKKPGADWGNHKVNTISRFREMGIEPSLFLEDWPKMADEIEAAGVPVLRITPPYGEEDSLWPRFAM